jgi:deaminated glutathione amidase
MLAAVGQLCSTSNIASNLNAARSIIQRASSAGAKAVFLPEATDFIAQATHVAELTRSAENKSFVKGICQAAKECGVFVTVGVHEDPNEAVDLRLKEPEPSRCYNTQLLISSEGHILQKYRKVRARADPTSNESRLNIVGDALISGAPL